MSAPQYEYCIKLRETRELASLITLADLIYNQRRDRNLPFRFHMFNESGVSEEVSDSSRAHSLIAEKFISNKRLAADLYLPLYYRDSESHPWYLHYYPKSRLIKIREGVGIKIQYETDEAYKKSMGVLKTFALTISENMDPEAVYLQQDGAPYTDQDYGTFYEYHSDPYVFCVVPDSVGVKLLPKIKEQIGRSEMIELLKKYKYTTSRGTACDIVEFDNGGVAIDCFRIGGSPDNLDFRKLLAPELRKKGIDLQADFKTWGENWVKEVNYYGDS